MIVTPERAAAAVDRVQTELVESAPDVVGLVLNNDRLRAALEAFRDGAIAGLKNEPDSTSLERKLLVLKRDVLAAAPDRVFTLERLLARAVQSVVEVARGG